MKINPMAKIFKNRIKDGIMTLDEVPEDGEKQQESFWRKIIKKT